MRVGLISIRNEDGTQWRTKDGAWSPRRVDAHRFAWEVFEGLRGTVEESKRNDCPDNGFFGLWNLTFHQQD